MIIQQPRHWIIIVKSIITGAAKPLSTWVEIVPGHHSVDGNVKAYAVNETMACNDVLTPLNVVTKIDDCGLRKFQPDGLQSTPV